MIRKLANKVKYISKINGGLIMFFSEIWEEFLKLVGSIVKILETINTRKEINSSVFKVPIISH